MSNQKHYIRYLVLLLILLAIASQDLFHYLKVHVSDQALSIHIIPISGDESDSTSRYINLLNAEGFIDISTFLDRETTRYSVQHERQFTINLVEGISSHPPELPPNTDNILSNIVWSIKFRMWSIWTQLKHPNSEADIFIYVKFFDPQKFSRVDFSVGLQKGLIGLVNAYAHADYQGSNNVIIAHELLHILGAHDKYDAKTHQPLYPTGYAEPNKRPLHPQNKAEIMGGRIPLTPSTAEIPSSLDRVIIGRQTANELRWIDSNVQ